MIIDFTAGLVGREPTRAVVEVAEPDGAVRVITDIRSIDTATGEYVYGHMGFKNRGRVKSGRVIFKIGPDTHG